MDHWHTNIFIGKATGTMDSFVLDNIAIGHSSQNSMSDCFGNVSVGNHNLKVNESNNLTAIGQAALSNNTSGVDNTAVGSRALIDNTIGSYCTAVGNNALFFNTEGFHNTAQGYQSLRANTIGSFNTAVGSFSLYSNTSGANNTAIAHLALYSNTSGIHNIAVGESSLFSNTTGFQNTAVGSHALNGNTIGSLNTAIGSWALSDNTFGFGNTAIGDKSMELNTSGSQNMAAGHYALSGNTSGSENTAIGVKAQFGNENGSQNTSLGYESLLANTSSSQNTAMGHQSGYSTIGNGNVFLGYRAGYNEQGSNHLYIANDSTQSPLIYGDFQEDEVNVNGKLGVNQKEPISDLHVKQKNNIDRGIRLEYNSDTDHWETYVDASKDYNFSFNGVLKSYINDADGSYSVFSDARLKSDIQDLEVSLENVLALNPVSYYYTDDPTKRGQLGFVAQEVESLFPQAVTEKEGYKSINYSVFGVLAIHAIQKQEARIEQLEKQVAQLIELLEK
jgi:hypothetical protein